MTRDDVERKFRMNAKQRLDEPRMTQALGAFWAIEERHDLDGLMALLA